MFIAVKINETQMDQLKTLTIRPFSINDYDAVIALWQECGLPFHPNGRDSYQRIEMEIKQTRCFFIVADIGSRIIGTVLGTQDGRKVWINRLAVADGFRRQKIAQILLTAVEKHFEADGLEVFSCLIDIENVASGQFFENADYHKYPHIQYYSKRKHGDA